MAGDNRGAYVMPQVGDEVLVVFNHGDVREPYVIGSLWNGQGKPPVTAPNDADSKWVIRTPKGHEIVFDDATRSICIQTGTKQTVTLTDQQIELSMDDTKTTTITLDTNGNVTIKAKETLKLEAKTIEVQETGKTTFRIAGSVVNIGGGSQCKIDATRIDIG
jgi:phage baseplate assembly protein V